MSKKNKAGDTKGSMADFIQYSCRKEQISVLDQCSTRCGYHTLGLLAIHKGLIAKKIIAIIFPWSIRVALLFH